MVKKLAPLITRAVAAPLFTFGYQMALARYEDGKGNKDMTARALEKHDQICTHPEPGGGVAVG